MHRLAVTDTLDEAVRQAVSAEADLDEVDPTHRAREALRRRDIGSVFHVDFDRLTEATPQNTGSSDAFDDLGNHESGPGWCRHRHGHMLTMANAP